MSTIQRESVAKSWRKGPPPSVGWWPASRHKMKVYRWWNGEYWSAGATSEVSAERAGVAAARRSIYSNEEIFWRERPSDWPERSRT